MIGLVPIGRHGVHTHARRIAVQVEGEFAGDRLQRLEFGGRRRPEGLLQRGQRGRREAGRILGRHKELVGAAGIDRREKIPDRLELLVQAVESVPLDRI